MQGRSKKAFSKNVATEMNAGKPQDQSLAIAYSVKKKNKKSPKKMAEGGDVSASNEKRPMPDNGYDDAHQIARNSAKKALHESDMTDNPTIKQAQSNDSRRIMPIKRPKMVPTNAFSTRLYDEEGSLQDSASPGPYGKQPPKHDDEMDADKSGDEISDMAAQHNNRRAPYNKAIEDQYSQDMAAAEMKMADGGSVSMRPDDSGIQERERSDEASLMSMEDPSEDEGMSDARSRDEMGQDRQGPEVPDMEDEHSTDRKPYAGGGRIGDSKANMHEETYTNPADDRHSMDDSETQPEPESSDDHEQSLHAAVMAKRARMHAEIDSGAHDEDDAVMMAEGGEVDLSRNADEDPNMEDQMSFDALKKENYSETPGLDDLDSPMDSAQHGDEEERDAEDEHDMVSSVRRKMAMKRQFPKL